MSKSLYQAFSLIFFWYYCTGLLVGQSTKDTSAWRQIFNELIGNQALAQRIWQDSLLQQHLYQGMIILHDTAQAPIAGSYYCLANVDKLSQTVSNYVFKYYPQHREAITAHIAEFWEPLHRVNNTIAKKIQTVEPEECIIICNNHAVLYWASHYELLADTISNTIFDTAIIAKTLYNYAAERVFTDQSYPFSEQLSNYLETKNILHIPNVPIPSAPYPLFYENLSNTTVDGLRAVLPNTFTIWIWMLGGLLVGIIISIIYHQYFWKQHPTNNKDL